MDKLIQKLKNSLLARASLVGAVALSAAIIYLISAIQLNEQGYPLDDAWIHQTYARNLIQFGEWSFNPGQVSGGSTSPLWTVILSIGYILGMPVLWTYLSGIILFAGSAIFGMEILIRARCSIICGILFGLFFATEWHFIWASVSGMETILVIFVLMTCFYCLYDRKLIWVSGMLAGLAIWVRPDSITLIGPLLWVGIFSGTKDGKNWKSVSIGIGIFLLIACAYLVLNYSLTGKLWPNTFFAKQAEYAVLQDTHLAVRLWKLGSLPWIGASILLLPGLVFTIYQILKQRNMPNLAPILWALGYILVFAVRLPVTYQHGRYIMPAMPILFLASFWGVQKLLAALNSLKLWQRIVRKSWVLAIGITQIGFLLFGAQTYARDVAIINTEMVQTANWIKANTENDSLIAAHDIGALGYFSNREIIDLAGLISPEVIPFIRNEDKLASYISMKNADYLVVFPSWYPELAARATPVYYSKEVFSPEMGGENMYVYKWQP